MKFKRGNKKGFTIVELVIVIAVIAILASVLIPTFSNMIKKAKRAADTQLVRTINNYVQMDLATKEADKHSSMHEAILSSRKYGLSPDALTTRSDYSLAWDSQTGLFVLLETGSTSTKVIYPTSEDGTSEYEIDLTNKVDSEKKAIDFFIVTEYKKYSLNTPYSTYAYGEGWPTEVTTCTGFDTGAIDTITKVNYLNKSGNEQNVIIRTNTFKTRLSVDSPLDTVSHYGFAGMVNIVTNKTYNEYGTVGRLTMTDDGATGAVAVKFGGTIYQIEQNNDNNNTSVSIAYNSKVYNINGEALTETNNSQTICCDKAILGDNGCQHDAGTGIFNDGVTDYEVCKKCGYTLVTLNDTLKRTVVSKDLKGDQNVITPMISYYAADEEKVKANSPLGDIVINDNIFETVPEVINDGTIVTDLCSDTNHKPKYDKLGKNDQGYYQHRITCTNYVKDSTEKCSYNVIQNCDLGTNGKCKVCGQTFVSGCYGLNNATVTLDFTIKDGVLTNVSSLENVEHVIIPNSVNEIETQVFYNNQTITNVVIPSTVTSINSVQEEGYSPAYYVGAFERCSNLTSVTFLKDGDGECNLKSIGEGTFSGCKNLETIDIPESVEIIDGYAFSGCTSLTEVDLPESIKEINSGAFCGCSSLKEIDFSECDELYYIGQWAFALCYSLKTVDLTDCETLCTKKGYSVMMDAFPYCISLLEVKIPDNAVIASGVEGCFSYCINLYSFTLSENMRLHCNNGFYYCESLIDMTDLRTNKYNLYYPSEKFLTNMYHTDREQCIQNKAYVELKNSTTDSTNIYYTCDNEGNRQFQFYDDGINTPILIKYVGLSDENVTLPEYTRGETAVEYIVSKSAFDYRSITGTLTIPANCSFEDGLFDRISLFIYDTNIGSAKNIYFTGLTEIDNIIVDSDNTNYSYVDGILYNSNNAIFIPSNVTSLTIPNVTDLNIDHLLFINNCKTFLYNNQSAIGTQIKVTQYSNNKETAKVFNNLTSITFNASNCDLPDYSFYNCQNLTTLTFNGDNITFGKYAFSGCTRLNNVTLPTNHTCDIYAFMDCPGIQNIKIANDIQYLCSNYLNDWFGNCTNLVSINVVGSSSNYFSDAQGILHYNSDNNIYVPYAYSGILTIDKENYIDWLIAGPNVTGFVLPQDCYSYSTINNGTIIVEGKDIVKVCPNAIINGTFNVTSNFENIREYAFSGCNNLTSINISSQCIDIYNYAFSYCNNLQNVIITACETYLEDFCFENCPNLTSINISSDYIDIYPFAFNYCNNLKNVILNVCDICLESCCFANCPNLTNITYNSLYSTDEQSALCIMDYNYYNYANNTNINKVTINLGNSVLQLYADELNITELEFDISYNDFINMEHDYIETGFFDGNYEFDGVFANKNVTFKFTDKTISYNEMKAIYE